MSRIFNDGSANAAQGHYFNGMYLPDTPLWYIQGCDTSGNANLAVFGTSSNELPLAGITENGYSAVGGTGVQGYMENSEANNYRAHGYSSTMNTQGLDPQSGYMGISCDGDGFNHRSEIMDNRGALLPTPYNMTVNAQYLGTVVGEPGYQRGINLFLNGTSIYLRPLSGLFNHLTHTPEGQGRLTLSADHLTAPIAGKVAEMTGSIGYNRRTDTLMLVQNNSGYNQFRLHIWTGLSAKIGLDSVALGAMLKAAKTAGDYRFIDYDTSTAGGYSGTSQKGWYGNIKVVPCDDGSAWLGHRYTGAHQLFAFDGTKVSLAKSLGCNTGRGVEHGGYYAQKHQLSFDQSRIAIYAPYYYYLTGANLFYCSTASAVGFSWYQNTATSNRSQSIAPIGGRAFALIDHSNFDINTGAYDLRLIDQHDDQMKGAALPDFRFSPAVSGYTASTNYSGLFLGRLLHHPSESNEFNEGLLTV